VCLRVAWRALVLAGQSAGQILSTLGRVLEHERADDTMFATLGMLSVAPDRATGWVRLAGHMPPLLITRGAAVRELAAPPSPPPGLGSPDDWPGVQVTLAEPPAPWSVLLFTDGLIEGRIGAGPERLGSDGLIRIIGEILATSPDLPDDQLLDQVIDRVRKLNQGDLDDDMAVLALGWRP
jgi:serine phosphatase RsbU (regulator of sigma subunit)